MLASSSNRPILFCNLRVSVLVLAISAPMLLDAKEELPAEVRAALEQNANALDPTTVVWENRRETPLAPNQLAQMLQFRGKADEFAVTKTVRYCWQDRRSYALITTHRISSTPADRSSSAIAKSTVGGTGRPTGREPEDTDGQSTSRRATAVPEEVTRTQEVAVDLVNWYNGNPDNAIRVGGEGSAIIGIRSLDQLRKDMPEAPIMRPDYFREAGFELPRTPIEQGRSQRSLVLHLIELGAEVENIEQSEVEDTVCLMVELVVELATNDRKYRFYLDPGMNYAVRRREEYTRDGELAVRVDCSRFAQFSEPQHWLPQHCEVEHYNWYSNPGLFSEDPLVRESYTVKELHHRPIPPEQFVLKYTKPGTFVADNTVPEAKALPRRQIQYRIPADPAQLDAVIAAAKRGETSFGTGIPPGNEGRSNKMWLMIVVNIVALALFAGWWVWRSLLRKHQQS